MPVRRIRSRFAGVLLGVVQLVASSACGGPSGARGAAKGDALDGDACARLDASGVVSLLTHPDSDLPTRVRCEARLRALPARDVLQRISREPLSAMPEGPVFNSGGTAESDAGGPLAWQVHYALQRVRHHHLRHASSSELREALMAEAATGKGADPDLVDLEIFFTHRGPPDPAMGAVGLRVMGDGARPEQQRRKAAQALLELDRGRYYLQVVDFAASLPRAGDLLDLLSRRPEHVKGPDARILRKEFAHLEVLAAANPASPHEAYFLAASLEDYVGEGFRPGNPEPYRHATGLTDAYFFDTVKNALAWWRTHEDGVAR